MDLAKEKKFAAGLSIFSNAVVILLKLVAGIVLGSISIISEAVHSLSDFLASVLTFFAVSRSSEPADKGHPFGHGKYEEMSGFIEGGLIIFAGFYIIYEAALKIIAKDMNAQDPTIGIWVMGFSIVANFLVSRYLFSVAKKTSSVSLFADAEHLRTDILSAFGVLVGLVLIKITGIFLLDPIVAIIVAVIILKAGYSISKSTLNNLLDGALPDNEIEDLEKILQSMPLIKGYKNLKARKSGQNKDIDVTVFFQSDLTICECHKTCDAIEAQILALFPNASVTIHAEPLCVEVEAL